MLYYDSIQVRIGSVGILVTVSLTLSADIGKFQNYLMLKILLD